MKQSIAFCSLFIFLLLSLASTLHAVELSSLSPSHVVLEPCQETVFSFRVNNNQPMDETVELTSTGLPGFLNYSLQRVASVPAGSSILSRVVVQYPCDADKQGVFPFTVVATSGLQRQSAASAVVETATGNSISLTLHQLDRSPSGGEYACSCESAHFSLEVRNAGKKLQQGTVLVSSNFTSSISSNTFSLAPGEMELKTITLDLPCSTRGGVYPLSVLIARRGASETRPLAFQRSGISVTQCYSSFLSGRSALKACLDGGFNFPYEIANTGEVRQSYALASTLGSFAPSQLTVDRFSTGVANLEVDSNKVNQAGSYPFEISLEWERDSILIPSVLEMQYCPGVTMESIDGEVANASQPFKVTPGASNTLEVTLTNFNRFTWHTAHLELSEFGRVSDDFELSPGQNITLPVQFYAPSNFTSRNSTLFLFTNEGNASTVIQLQAGSSSLSGFFTLVGLNLNGWQVIILAIVLFLLVAALYHLHVEGENMKETDEAVAGNLELIVSRTKSSQ